MCNPRSFLTFSPFEKKLREPYKTSESYSIPTKCSFTLFLLQKDYDSVKTMFYILCSTLCCTLNSKRLFTYREHVKHHKPTEIK